MRTLAVAPILLLLCLLPLTGCSQEPTPPSADATATGISQGMQAPDFTLTDLDGTTFTLSSRRGKSAVCLIFWGTWCPYCVREIPRLKQLQATYADAPFEIIGINVGANDPIERVRGFARQAQLPYPTLYDRNQAVSRLFAVQGIPVSILIDRQGIIRFRGYQLPEQADALIKALL